MSSEALNPQNKPDRAFEPVITDFAASTAGIKFKKDVLVGELLSFGNTKITRQIAGLIGDEVEQEIHRRRIQFLSAELISEMVAGKLEELGLIKARGESIKNEKKEKVLTPELLEVMSPADKGDGIFPAHAKPTMSVELGLEGKKLLEGCRIRDENGQLIETADQLFFRVAGALSSADVRYNPMADIRELESRFYNLMAAGEFLPEFSVFQNAGRSMGQIASGYVLPVNDTAESIFEAMKQAAQIHKKGGAAGFSFTRLRPRKDVAGKVSGKSGGPVAFLHIFQAVMEMLFQEGSPPASGCGVLNVNHPDILDFIGSPFAATIGVTGHFIRMVEENRQIQLINPCSGLSVEEMPARRLFTQIVSQIREKGFPDILFLDRIGAANPTPREGMPEAVTPQSGQPLLPFETIAVGGLNLSRHVEGGQIYWGKLRKNIGLAVHLLDNVLEVNHYPVPESARISQKNRKIALSLMGWGSLLQMLKIPYGSDESFALAERVASFVHREAENASEEMAGQRGVFGGYADSIFFNKGSNRRHALLTAVPEMPFMAQVAGCSQGIAPAAGEASSAECLLHMQAVFQKFAENSVSLKIPVSPAARNEDIGQIFLNAFHLGIKHLSFNKEEAQVLLNLPEPDQRPVVVRNLQEPEGGAYFRPPEDAEI